MVLRHFSYFLEGKEAATSNASEQEDAIDEGNHWKGVHKVACHYFGICSWDICEVKVLKVEWITSSIHIPIEYTTRIWWSLWLSLKFRRNLHAYRSCIIINWNVHSWEYLRGQIKQTIHCNIASVVWIRFPVWESRVHKNNIVLASLALLGIIHVIDVDIGNFCTIWSSVENAHRCQNECYQ